VKNIWIKTLARMNMKCVGEVIELVEENKQLKEHIKKLSKRIHNQRVALRENWMITEQRRKPWQLKFMARLYRERKEQQKELEFYREQALDKYIEASQKLGQEF